MTPKSQPESPGKKGRIPLSTNEKKRLKRCCKCKKWRPFTAFGLNASRPDGMQSECRPCKKMIASEYYQEVLRPAKLKKRLEMVKQKREARKRGEA